LQLRAASWQNQAPRRAAASQRAEPGGRCHYASARTACLQRVKTGPPTRRPTSFPQVLCPSVYVPPAGGRATPPGCAPRASAAAITYAPIAPCRARVAAGAARRGALPAGAGDPTVPAAPPDARPRRRPRPECRAICAAPAAGIGRGRERRRAARRPCISFCTHTRGARLPLAARRASASAPADRHWGAAHVPHLPCSPARSAAPRGRRGSRVPTFAAAVLFLVCSFSYYFFSLLPHAPDAHARVPRTLRHLVIPPTRRWRASS